MSHPRTAKSLLRSGIALLATLAVLLLPLAAAAASPTAGTSIGNQASATYSDASNVTRTVTSNTVVTIVQQVATLQLTANGAKNVALGGLVSYPHTLTNTGNGNDTFNLATNNTGGFTFTSVALYADANGDGVPDNTTAITSTGQIAPGGTFKFVAVGLVPVSAVAGNTNTLTLTAASTFLPAATGFNLDVTTVSGNAIINVTKAIDIAIGLPGPAAGARTYTLTYVNTGVSPATNVTLTDVIPSGMTYIGGSARWSGTGSTPLTDGTGDNQSGMLYDFNITSANRVTAIIASVPVGASGTLTFQATVNSNTPPGANAATLNTAAFTYNDGASTIGPANTNGVQFVVAQSAGVLMNGDTSNNIVQGGTVTFIDLLTNTGSGVDSFDIAIGSSTFPVGTTFTLYQADGVTPLLDSNGNGIPDTGPIAALGTRNVVIKATLPPGSTGGNFTVQVLAVSKLDPTKTASANNTLNTVTTSTVDLTNNAANGGGALGTGPGPEGSPAVTNTVAAGASTRFTLYVSNTSGVADTYNLQASTDVAFGGLNLPAGWTVVFRDANDVVITNTGVINAGANRLVYADVTVPPNTLASTVDMYFRALSPTSGAADRLHDAVAVAAARTIVLAPNHSGQAAVGGTSIYTHVIANNGNVLEGDGVLSQVTLSTSDSVNGFTSTVYWDQNNNGVLDPTDPAITSLAQLVGGINGASTAAGLSPGEQATLFVKVDAAPGAPVGAIDTSTLTATTVGVVSATPAPLPVSVTNSTTIIAGDLQLQKLQALDANCDGIADTAFSAANISTGAIPGACVRYQITATNIGSANVTTVVVSDATPTHTTYHATAGATTTVGSVAAPGAGTTGTVQATVGTLTPNQTAVLTFGVRIDP